MAAAIVAAKLPQLAPTTNPTVSIATAAISRSINNAWARRAN